ncbi:hypothetical protein [uncultured phage MedDCM-OCT-S09-C28]|nr:hypothetical protein [uncultured phage MedDCM-OCT-S09-C28]
MKSQLKQERQLLAELHVAKELGMTLGQMRREMTYEELWLWLTYFGLMNDQQDERMKKAQRGRR